MKAHFWKILSRAERGNEWGLGLSGFASLESDTEPRVPEANLYSFFMTQLNGTTICEAFSDSLSAVSPEAAQSLGRSTLLGNWGYLKEAGMGKRLGDCTCH